MTRSPVFWFVAGIASTYAYHRFVKPMPSAKA
jgi:hypothetical protein